MFNSIFSKTLYERRWFLVAWILAIFGMTLLTMAFYPFFKNSGFDEVIANAPKSLQGVLGQAANYKTVSGYVDQQIFALRLPLLTIIMGVVLFIGIGVGDEDRGTLENLLAQPVSRSQVFWQKFAAGSLILALGCLCIFFAVIASFPLINGSMNLVNLAAACFGCWLISMVFGGLAYAFGMATGKRALTVGVASGLAFFTYLISSLAPAVDKLKDAVKFTPFYYYNTPGIALDGLRWRNVGLLLGIVLAMVITAVVIFKQRDLVRD